MNRSSGLQRLVELPRFSGHLDVPMFSGVGLLDDRLSSNPWRTVRPRRYPPEFRNRAAVLAREKAAQVAKAWGSASRAHGAGWPALMRARAAGRAWPATSVPGWSRCTGTSGGWRPRRRSCAGLRRFFARGDRPKIALRLAVTLPRTGSPVAVACRVPGVCAGFLRVARRVPSARQRADEQPTAIITQIH